MSVQANPTPEWYSYAEQVIQTLLALRRKRLLALSPLTALREDDLFDMDGSDPPTDPSADSEAPDTTDEAPITGSVAPAPRLSAREVSLAIRLAATLGDATAIQEACADGAITVIVGIAAEDLEDVSKIVEHALLPPRTPIHRLLATAVPDTERVVVLLHMGSRGSGSSSEAARFRKVFAEALALDLPLIVLLQDAAQLPEDLRLAARVLRFARLSQEVLIAHLAQSHGAGGELDAAIGAALPPVHLLAALPFSTLLLALRAPDGPAVAARLAELAQPPATSGPRLETMTGESAALTAARRLIADLRDWQAGHIGWQDLSRSLLLFGPPGTGKTWLARAMGNSAGIAMVRGSFAEWQSAGHLGDLLRETRKSFAEARRLAPAILFIDEIDAIGSREGGDWHGSSYRAQVINGFLAELDSIGHAEGVIVVGACNEPTRIDPAVLRPGRFDLKIAMRFPDASTIRGLLTHHLGHLFQQDELEQLARHATGHSAAAIDAAIRAARSDARHGQRPLTIRDILDQLGLCQSPEQIALEHRIALHECGHAIAATALGRGPVTRLLITPEGGENHRRVRMRAGLRPDHLAELGYLLAGRAAERLILGDVSSGAGGPADSDLATATTLALALETRYGLGEHGPVWSDIPTQTALRDPQLRTRIRQALDTAEARATDILTLYRDLLVDMAGALQKRRELSGTDLRLWLAPLRDTQIEGVAVELAAKAPVDDTGPASPAASPNTADGASTGAVAGGSLRVPDAATPCDGRDGPASRESRVKGAASPRPPSPP